MLLPEGTISRNDFVALTLPGVAIVARDSVTLKGELPDSHLNK